MLGPHAKPQGRKDPKVFFVVWIKILCGLAALREQKIKMDRSTLRLSTGTIPLLSLLLSTLFVAD
jgi:uncharacterized membrane protein